MGDLISRQAEKRTEIARKTHACDCISRQQAIDGADAIIAMDTSGNNDVVKAMTAWKSYVEALPSAQPERMRFVQQAVNMIMHTAKSDSIKDKSFRNAARMIQNAIDGEPQDFEPISDEPERKEGKWIYAEHDIAMCDGYMCDQCGFFVPWDYKHKSIDFIKDYHWCPSCGADMRCEDDDIPIEYFESGGI